MTDLEYDDGWLPISKLPEKGEVLAYIDGGYVLCFVAHARKYAEKWQPLPEPPITKNKEFFSEKAEQVIEEIFVLSRNCRDTEESKINLLAFDFLKAIKEWRSQKSRRIGETK